MSVLNCRVVIVIFCNNSYKITVVKFFLLLYFLLWNIVQIKNKR
jgi:hypothetical protein